MSGYNKVYLAFEQAALSCPEELCVVAGPTALTYGELEEKVAKLHRAILGRAADDKIIGVPTTRGIE